MDSSGVQRVPGPRNRISYIFNSDIDENGAIYTSNSVTTATISFCVEIGYYFGDFMVNYAEAKVGSPGRSLAVVSLMFEII